MQHFAFLLVATGSLQQTPTPVELHIHEAGSDEPSPAMICIRREGPAAEAEVRLPPDGRVLAGTSEVDTFYRGVDFSEDPNWMGPVRKTLGAGNNSDRSFVYGELRSVPYWDEPVAYQIQGDCSIELPAGRWRVAVDRGPEFIPVVEVLELPELSASSEPLLLDISSERWIDMPERGWWSGDVHVHHPTEEQVHREYLLSYAEAVDLHVVNTLAMGHHQGVDFPQRGFGVKSRTQVGDRCLVSGREDPRSTFGHIIGLNIDAFEQDLEHYDLYDHAFDRIHAHEPAVVGYAHFSWNGCDLPRGLPWYITTGAIEFVELMQFARINSADYYDYLNLGFKLTAAAGSDIPWASSMGEVRTYVHTGHDREAGLDIDAWFRGLKAGHTFVTNGPMLTFTIDGELPGSQLVRSLGETLEIVGKLEVHPKIGELVACELISNEGVVARASRSSEGSALDLLSQQPVRRSCWYILSGRCANGAMAHSSPI